MMLAASLLAATLACAAGAQTNWSGPYAGVNGGYAWGNASTAFDGDGDGSGIFALGQGYQSEPPDGGFNQAPHGALYGVYFGYNAPIWRNVVGGFEAAYDRGNIYAQALNPLVTSYGGPDTAYRLYVDSLFSFTPQLGFGWGPVLLRGKAGAVAGHVVSRFWSNEAYFGFPPGVNTTFDQDQTRIGWTWGTGLDYALAEHWITGIAFDYYDFRNIHYGGETVPDVNWPLSYAIHPILRAVTARLAYKFGVGTTASAVSSSVMEAPAVPSQERRVDDLIRKLKRGDDGARVKAAIALGELGSRDAVEPLIAAMGDESYVVRGAAADALGKIGDGSAVDSVAALLRDPQPKVRALAARALGSLGEPRALPWLRKTADDDSDPLVRKLAAVGAGDAVVGKSRQTAGFLLSSEPCQLG